MDQQTQAFLALVSDELTTLIRSALAEMALSSTELAETTQTDPRIIAKHLEAMKLGGLVRSDRVPGQGRGRPRIYWKLINESAVEELIDFVKKLRHGLIESGDE
jgi:predicted ArsR family transcriptional regulator